MDAATGYELNLQGLYGTVVLGSGNNIVIGNSAATNHIIGGSGNNIIIGGAENDTSCGNWVGPQRSGRNGRQRFVDCQ